jgi:hypothetical protein
VFELDYNVRLQWDDEAAVWVADSPDVPGLVLESGSFDALIERVRFAVPELLALNVLPRKPMRLNFHSDRQVAL